MTRAKGSRVRRGLSLAELLVSMALIAAVGALIIPAVKTRLDMAQISAVIDNLDNLRAVIVQYKEDVGRYPSHLRQLQTKPGVGGVPATDICGTAVPAWARDRWQGPYIANPITGTGIDVKGVTIADALVREALAFSGEYLYIPITGLDSAMANVIDLNFDGSTGSGSGTVRYSPPGCTALTCTVRFYMPISPC